MKKQLFVDVPQNRCSRKSLKFHRKTPVLESLIKKVADLKAWNFIKKRLQHKYFPVKFVKFLRTPFFYRTPPVAASDNAEDVITTDCHLLCCFCQPVNRNQAFSIFKQVHELRHEQCNRSISQKWYKDRSLIIQNLVLTLKSMMVGGLNWIPPLWFFQKFIF